MGLNMTHQSRCLIGNPHVPHIAVQVSHLGLLDPVSVGTGRRFVGQERLIGLQNDEGLVMFSDFGPGFTLEGNDCVVHFDVTGEQLL